VPLSDADLIRLWATAASSPLGVRIPCSDPSALQSKLYRVRKDHDHTQAWSGYTIRTKSSELWIISPQARGAQSAPTSIDEFLDLPEP